MHTRRNQRRRFNLLELVLVTTIVISLASLLLPIIYRSSRQAKSMVCSSHQNQLSTWINLYTSANDDLLPAYEDGWVLRIAIMGNIDVDDNLAPEGVFACPSQAFVSHGPGVDPERWWRGSHYGLNQHMASNLKTYQGQALASWTQANVRKPKTPQDKLLLADATGGNFFGFRDRDPVVAGISRSGKGYADSLPPGPAPPFPYLRHLDGVGNFLFLDGHVDACHNWPEFMLGRGTRGYQFWHAEHWYPDLGMPSPDAGVKPPKKTNP